MRRLVLMRHAKTEATNAAGDKARRLAPRGVREAQEAGVALARLGVDAALVSSAERTRGTFAALGLKAPVEFSDGLYFGGGDTALTLIGDTPDEVGCLLVVGHAPTIPGLVAELAEAGNPAAAEDAVSWYPTGTWTVFEFDGPWERLGERDFAGVRLAGITRPR